MKKVVIIISIILFCFASSLLIYLSYPRFMVKNLKDERIFIYGNEFNKDFSVCYGNYFKCKKVDGKIINKDDMNILGKHKIKYLFVYNDKKKEISQIVNTIDNEKPTISIDGEDFWYCSNGYIPDYHIISIDNYDGDISNKVTKKIVDNKLVITSIDSSSNKAELIKNATIKEESPTITLNGDAIYYLNLYSNYNELGASANDICDGDISHKIEISGSVNTNVPGEYNINYKVKNSSNIEKVVTRKVIVRKPKPSYEGKGSTIYLTFDDGPSAYTDILLDVLKKYNVKATFFVTNQGLTRGHDSSILRAFNEGHTIGLHSNTHEYSYIYANSENYFSDLEAIQNKVRGITGSSATIIRFPGGSSNTVSRYYDGGTKIMTYLTNSVETKGYRYFDWNIDSEDAGGATSSSKVAANVIKGLRGNGSYVILQHDTKKYSVDAVESIIVYGLNHGYVFAPLTNDSPRVEHGINN